MTTEEIITFISQNEVLAYDIETTGLNPRKDRVMGFGISNSAHGLYVPVLEWTSQLGFCQTNKYTLQNIHEILCALYAKKLITWNAAFDIKFTKLQLGVDLLPALYADIMLLKHTCDEEFPFGLKEVAASLWGKSVINEKLDMLQSIKSNKGSAKEYYKASEELLAKYCVQDCILTYKLFSYYSKELKAQKLEKFFYEDEVMPLYKKVTIPMEERGVQLDMPLLCSLSEKIHASLQKCEQDIQFAISPYLNEFIPQFLEKEYPLKTRGRLCKMLMIADGDILDARKALWAVDDNGPMFNLQSTHHLKKLFFNILKEIPLSTTPTGLPQINEEFLNTMAIKYTWAADLIIYNKLRKLKSTYVERFLNENENGRFYPAFMQHRTVSGRYAGDFQQLPRPLKGEGIVAHFTSRIRECILPTEGNALLSADYQQLEPSIFAHTSGDKELQQIFKEGKDFYSEIAIRTESLQGSSDKGSELYIGTLWPEARQKAKTYALGIAYGMTAYKLKFEIGVSDAEAETLVQSYLGAFPGLAAWMEESKVTAYTVGHVTSEAGRMRRLSKAKSLWDTYGPCLLNDLELWKKYNTDGFRYKIAKADRKVFKNLLNNAINFQVQSLAASIVNRAAISLVDKFAENNMKTAIIAQIHDELLFDIPYSELDSAKSLIKDVMENIVQLAVPLVVMPKIGQNFKECK